MPYSQRKKEYMHKYMVQWRKRHRKQLNAIAMRSYYRKRMEVLVHYSGTDPPQCANPFGEHKEPYTTEEALSIDHIKGNGAEQRRETNGSSKFLYLWLRNNNYPEGYQVLCMNCQWIKRRRNRETVHSQSK